MRTLQVRVIIERLVRKLDFESVSEHLPEGERKLLVHIRREHVRKAKKGQSEAGSEVGNSSLHFFKIYNLHIVYWCNKKGSVAPNMHPQFDAENEVSMLYQQLGAVPNKDHISKEIRLWHDMALLHSRGTKIALLIAPLRWQFQLPHFQEHTLAFRISLFRKDMLSAAQHCCGSISYA